MGVVVGRQTARMKVTRADPLESGLSRHRRRPGSEIRGSVAQVAVGVVAPAVRDAGRGDAAGVGCTGTQGAKAHSVRNPYRAGAVGGASIAELTVVIPAPAPRNAVSPESAAMVLARAQALEPEAPRHGTRAGVGLVVATELAAVIPAPAPRDTLVTQCTRVCITGVYRPKPRFDGHAIRGCLTSPAGAAQLPEVVETPTPRRPVGGEPACVGGAGRQHLEREGSGDGNRRTAVYRVAGPELPCGIITPAPCRGGRCHDASVTRPDAQTGGGGPCWSRHVRSTTGHHQDKGHG
jgi:hypothetical protein